MSLPFVNKNYKFRSENQWYSSFQRKVSEKDGNPQTYSSFPVPTEMTGKILYHLQTPTQRGSIWPLFPPFDTADGATILICCCFRAAARDSGLAKRHTCTMNSVPFQPDFPVLFFLLLTVIMLQKPYYTPGKCVLASVPSIFA